MGRGKVSFTLIENESLRRTTMKRRSQGLMKKVSELTTLCGLPGVCMVYHPDEPQPMVWPTHDGVQQQLNRYFSIPEVERSKKTTTQETFLKERFTKEKAVYEKWTKKVDELNEAVLMDEVFYGKGLNGLHPDELDKLVSFLKKKVEELNKREEIRDGSPLVPPQPSHHWNIEAYGEEGTNQAGVVAPQQQIQGGSVEFGLAQNHHQDFGNTFIGSSYVMGQGSEKYTFDGENMDMVIADHGNLVPSRNDTMFPWGSDFNMPLPLSLSPTVHYHQQGSGMNLENVVVDGGMDNNKLCYYGSQLTRSVFEQGSSSMNPQPLAQGPLHQLVQPQQQIEASDNRGDRVWPPPQASDFSPRE